jgi:hypothetical protein
MAEIWPFLDYTQGRMFYRQRMKAQKQICKVIITKKISLNGISTDLLYLFIYSDLC